MKRLGVVLAACVLLCAFRPVLAQGEQDPHVLQWYYNPNGGRYAHIDPKCASVSAEYLPLKRMTHALEPKRMPCPYCAEATLVFTVSGGSAKMPDLRVEVYQTALKVPEWEEERVYRIHIADTDRPAHVFSDLLFPSMEGGDGLVPLVRMEDFNFDGYPDLAALRAQGASNVFSTHFLYSPGDGQYYYEPVFDALSAYTLYPEQGVITNSIHDSAATGARQVYRIGEGGRPMRYRDASIAYDERSEGQKIRIKVTEYDSAGAETVLMDAVREPFADNADYRESERKWLALLYEGMPESVVKSELGM